MTTTERATSILAELSPPEQGDGYASLGAGADPAQFVHDLIQGSGASLSAAAEAIARVEREVGALWRHAVATERRDVTDRLVEVSRALRRASKLLDGPGEIG